MRSAEDLPRANDVPGDLGLELFDAFELHLAPDARDDLQVHPLAGLSIAHTCSNASTLALATG